MKIVENNYYFDNTLSKHDIGMRSFGIDQM